jgi:hypothetical protein
MKGKEPLFIYKELKEVPKEALRTIQAGRLKGKSDINPQWRIEKMTEVFGAIGFGWNYKVTRAELVTSELSKEVACFCDIELKVKVEDQWSEPIFGTGGSMFVAQESRGAFTSDECFKMALTDALSVAMKQLGMAADVYRGFTDSKYNETETETAPKLAPLVKPQKMTETEYGKIELDIKMSTTAEELNQVIEDLNKKWVNDPAKVITVDQKKGLRELIEQRKNELK